jgi:hypothetical protein
MTTKRSHYIPVFYLRQWAVESEKLCQFSRPHNRIVAKRKHPSGTGYQDNLYSLLNLPDELAHWVEDVFLKVADQEGSDALQELLKGNIDLNPRLQSGWSRFMMSLLSRVPDKVATLRVMFDEEMLKQAPALEKAYDEFHASDTVLPSAARKAEELARETQFALGNLLKSVMDLEKVGNHFNHMPWCVLSLRNGRRNLLTSDRPIVLSNGLQNDDCYVLLPISPTKLFVAANDSVFLKNLSKQSSSDLTSWANRQVASQARRFIYGTDEFQINFADKFLKHHQSGD